METSCQFSYPLNSENASPPGTFTVYLSGADLAVAANMASAPSTAVVAPIVTTRFRFIARLCVAPCAPQVLGSLRNGGSIDWRLELVSIPVSDVDRAKRFYTEKAGFNADHDHQVNDELRFVQLTPPGSPTSIALGSGMS